MSVKKVKHEDVYREREREVLCVYLFKTIWEKRKPNLKRLIFT